MSNSQQRIWLASYPRSGNTLLRTVLWHCFGLQSASVYPNDLGGRRELEAYVGHIEHGPNRMIQFPAGMPSLIKTHELSKDDAQAIYVVRDGRAASVSLWEFYNKRISLEDIIIGRQRFGTWANHLMSWQPWARPNTLFIKYEDLVHDLVPVLEELGDFLRHNILQRSIPDRAQVANVDGRWVRGKSDWKSKISAEQLGLFESVNGEMLRKIGYAA